MPKGKGSCFPSDVVLQEKGWSKTGCGVFSRLPSPVLLYSVEGLYFFKLDLKFAVFVSIERLLEWAATPPIQNSSSACKNLDCPPEIQLFFMTEFNGV